MKQIQCPHCGKGVLLLIPAFEPFYPDHYQCNECDSTYCIEQIGELKEVNND